MPVFDTIVLLTGQAEQPVLSAALMACNPLLTIHAIATLSDLLSLDADALSHARLVAFSTNVIVPAQILNRLGYGAYNFHPGSPDFPGWAPAYFALHRRATEFGATAHRMTEHVDEGPIIGIELFRIPEGVTPAGLEGLSYGFLARLFWRFAKSLATQSAPLPEIPVKWRGEKTTRRMFKATFDLPSEISDEKLAHLIRECIR